MVHLFSSSNPRGNIRSVSVIHRKSCPRKYQLVENKRNHTPENWLKIILYLAHFKSLISSTIMLIFFLPTHLAKWSYYKNRKIVLRQKIYYKLLIAEKTYDLVYGFVRRGASKYILFDVLCRFWTLAIIPHLTTIPCPLSL